VDWDDVRHFLALARLGSVRAAGAQLGVSHSTVARRVEALEGQLAARLFDRHRDGYTLTEAGRQMLPSAERVEREMAALERGLVGQDERLAGPVTITCTDNYVAGLLLRELTPFCARYPDIELFVHVDSRYFDLSKREADIALRAVPEGSLPPQHLIGQKLVPVTLASYVALAHEDRLDPAREGSEARWLSFEERKLHESIVAGSSYPKLPLWGSFSTIELMVRAARAGFGLAMLPVYVGDQEPGLRRLARADVRAFGDLWLLSHADLRDNARMRATRAHIADVLRRALPLFSGAGRSADAPTGPEIASPDGDAAAVP
jgi:DNA-binding transcriptional LysR family regulator